ITIATLKLDVVELGIHCECDVGDKRPRSRRPNENATPTISGSPLPACRCSLSRRNEIERNIDARVLHIFPSLRDLVARECRAATRAIRENLVAAIKKIALVELSERPLDAFDLIVRVGDVGVVVVEPVAD